MVTNGALHEEESIKCQADINHVCYERLRGATTLAVHERAVSCSLDRLGSSVGPLSFSNYGFMKVADIAERLSISFN